MEHHASEIVGNLIRPHTLGKTGDQVLISIHLKEKHTPRLIGSNRLKVANLREIDQTVNLNKPHDLYRLSASGGIPPVKLNYHPPVVCEAPI